MNRIAPSSRNGRSTSCWARFQRWTSSRNRRSLCPARRHVLREERSASRTSVTVANAAERWMNRAPQCVAMSRPTVVFPVPGGPQNTSGTATSPSRSARKGPLSPRRCRCPTTSPRSRGRSRSARGARPCHRPSIQAHCSTLTELAHRPYHTVANHPGSAWGSFRGLGAGGR